MSPIMDLSVRLLELRLIHLRSVVNIPPLDLLFFAAAEPSERVLGTRRIRIGRSGAEPEKLMDHDGSGADFMEKLLRGYRMVWPPATPSSARAESSVAEASNAVLVGTYSSWQSPADPACGDGSPLSPPLLQNNDPAGGDGSPLSPPLLQNKPVGHLKRGKFRKLPRVRTALPFGTLVMSGGTTGMSGTLHRVEECSVLGRDVQLTVSLLSSNRPIPQPYSDSHTDSVPSCAESTLVRRARRGRISRASLCTTSTPSRAAQRTRSAHPSYTLPGAAPSRRSKRRGSRRRRTRARGLPRSSVCWMRCGRAQRVVRA